MPTLLLYTTKLGRHPEGLWVCFDDRAPHQAAVKPPSPRNSPATPPPSLSDSWPFFPPNTQSLRHTQITHPHMTNCKASWQARSVCYLSLSDPKIYGDIFVNVWHLSNMMVVDNATMTQGDPVTRHAG